MAKEHWYFLAGALIVAVPIVLLLAAKKFDLFELRPDTKITYAKIQDQELNLHVFHAVADNSEPVPALLLLHGGGWRYGNPQQFYQQCRFFAAQGITCFAAQYRLGPVNAPDVRGAIQDAAAALEYLHQNARQLGIDSERIYVGGGSSGGHLAASLGAGLQGEDRLKPAALVLYNPILDLSPCTPPHFLVRDYWREVSPLQRITNGFPPTLILSGTQDPEVPVATVESFCTAVQDAGGECETALYEGQSHGFFNYIAAGNPHFDQTNTRVLRFLRNTES